jgi:hypothetical protein
MGSLTLYPLSAPALATTQPLAPSCLFLVHEKKFRKLLTSWRKVQLGESHVCFLEAWNYREMRLLSLDGVGR